MPSPSASRSRLSLVAAIPLILLLAGCSVQAATSPSQPASGGSASRGASDIQHLGCGTCHTIPGITGAYANVGPPLTRIGTRTYIAGVLANNPANLMRWIRSPQSVVPGNAMPDMGVTEAQARDIAAYLYTLR